MGICVNFWLMPFKKVQKLHSSYLITKSVTWKKSEKGGRAPFPTRADSTKEVKRRQAY